jgi:aerobic-type carbon monoxide dehydrogenase small subunit (CoxS/CutS family)
MSDGVELEVNGVKHRVDADPETSLLEVIREDLGLTGTKYGCGESQCGACTLILGGQAVHSCVTQLSEAVGLPVLTIESLEKNGKLHPVQQAFLDNGAFQCGYCVSGMIMAAVALLESIPSPTEAQIVEHMSGNICRCGAYPRMIEAVKEAAIAMKGAK